ncbi:hypothetical protein [Aeoliella sp. SH292]|uniref:hypothetical protein n=1 Tax=Aeoliella sp. SH292 TaxID=3454464 RepID=UPI003F9D10FD
MLESTDFTLVQFENQIAREGHGVPDARILCSTCLLIETKTERNAVRVDQLERHLKRLDQAREAEQKLIVITPDDRAPVAMEKIRDPRLVWTSFAIVDQVIEELLSDPREVISEREAFLLRELQAMLLREKLIGSVNDVVVVAAREAWPEYQNYHAYVCQPNRTFQQVQRMGFYTHGAIQTLIPRILEAHVDVEFDPTKLKGDLKKLAVQLLEHSTRQKGSHFDVMFLSAPDSDDTVKLARPILNDIRAASGRPWAYTMSQRYVTLQALAKASTTSDLVEGD